MIDATTVFLLTIYRCEFFRAHFSLSLNICFVTSLFTLDSAHPQVLSLVSWRCIPCFEGSVVLNLHNHEHPFSFSFRNIKVEKKKKSTWLLFLQFSTSDFSLIVIAKFSCFFFWQGQLFSYVLANVSELILGRFLYSPGTH